MPIFGIIIGMRLAELHAVLAVARLGSFSAAARALGMSTTAVSRTIAAVEAQLRVRLFTRTTRAIAITAAGAALIGELAPSLAAVEAALARAHSPRDELAGTLRINSSLQGGRQIIPLVAAFTRQHPAVRFELVTERKMIDIVRAGFDAGIRSRDAVPKDMVRVPIGGAIAMLIVGSAGYVRAHGAPSSPAALADHRCIRYRSAPADYRWELVHGRREITVAVDGPLAVDDYQLAYEAVKADLGLAMLPRWVVAADLAAGRLVQILADATPDSAPLYLYYPAGRNPPPLVRAFALHVRKAGATLAV
jgi:DNA-binding transcriptional LysR family regulator